MSVYVSVIIYVVEQLGQTSIYLCIKESRLISDMKVKIKVFNTLQSIKTWTKFLILMGRQQDVLKLKPTQRT